MSIGDDMREGIDRAKQTIQLAAWRGWSRGIIGESSYIPSQEWDDDKLRDAVSKMAVPSVELRGRIDKALKIAVGFGGISGSHHKAWAIDQIVRALTGCPVEQKTMVDARGKTYVCTVQGESDEYKRLVAEAREGEDGPETYDWDYGIAP